METPLDKDLEGLDLKDAPNELEGGDGAGGIIEFFIPCDLRL